MKVMGIKAAGETAVAENGSKPVAPTFRNAFLFRLKLGFISFGGPTGQIAMMHQELVERRKWISNARFLHALNYCMLLQGKADGAFSTVGVDSHGSRMF